MVLVVNIIIGIIIGSIITFIIVKKTTKKEPDYSKLIERIMKEANADLSNCGKKKHTNKS